MTLVIQHFALWELDDEFLGLLLFKNYLGDENQKKVYLFTYNGSHLFHCLLSKLTVFKFNKNIFCYKFVLPITKFVTLQH